MTLQSTDASLFPSLQNMTSADVGDAMRERAAALKSRLTPNQAQSVDILLDMAGQVSTMAEDLVTDIGKAALVADLYRLDELLQA